MKPFSKSDPDMPGEYDADEDTLPGDQPLDQLPREAVGEDEHSRPQPAFEPVDDSQHDDLYRMMRKTVENLEADNATRGDLKLLSRTLRELRYALKVFRPFRRRRKLTIFGSARTKPGHPEYEAAVELGRKMAGHGWMVITGAGGGIMEAGHKGAGRDASMGLNIMLPFEQSANEFIDGDPKLVTMKYFFTRKLMFVKECSGVICLPGGFGTLDEALETLTLMQTGKQVLMPLVLLDAADGTYWKDLGAFMDKQLGGNGMISREDVHLYKITNSVDEAIDEVMGFYNVYHSMRYVHDQLVLRLKRRLSDEHVERIQRDYADICVKGTFQQTESLPEEAGESELAELPRLVFHFNRRNLGRLRMLIDDVNQ